MTEKLKSPIPTTTPGSIELKPLVVLRANGGLTTIDGVIQGLESLKAQGAPGYTVVHAFDEEQEDWEEVTCVIYEKGRVFILTGEA